MTGRLPSPPPLASRRATWRRCAFAALDFETTGLDYAHDNIVSFGVVPVRGGRILIDEAVHQLVEPPVPPSPASVKVHGYRMQDLIGSATAEQARESLREALDGRYILSWYAPVELAFLRRTFNRGARRLRRRTIDVRELAITLDRTVGRLGEPGTYSLSACASRYGVPVARPHDALDDALVTAQVFLVLAERLSRGGRGTAARLLRAGRS